MFLRDLAIYADPEVADRLGGGFAGCFHRDTCAITDLYLFGLYRKVTTDDTAKLLLWVVDVRSPSGQLPRLVQLSNVLELYWPFDFDVYQAANDVQKRHQIIALLHNAATWAAMQKQWDARVFEEAHEYALGKELILNGFWTKTTWPSPDREFRVKVHYRVDLRSVELSAALFDRADRELERSSLYGGVPENDCLRALIGKGRWKSKSTFELRSARTYRSEVWTVTFESPVSPRERRGWGIS